MDFVSEILIEQGFKVIKASNKKNKFLRLLDMIYCSLKNLKTTDYVLIDTFSTLNFYYAFIISQICRLFNVKYIPILHGGNLPKRIIRNKILSKLIFSNSYINISPSEYLKKEFSNHSFNVKVIPNTININTYKFKKRSEVACKLLWVRAFDKTYNPIMVIDVLKELVSKYNDLTICMVGPDKDGSLTKFKNELIKNKLENHVTITGFKPKEDWHQLSKNYDIFLNTTNIDNTPVSLIEAMALGLPIISTNVGGIPFLIKNKKNGILVSKNNAKEMATKICCLINNSTLVETLSINGRKTAENFSKEKVTSQWVNLLN